MPRYILTFICCLVFIQLNAQSEDLQWLFGRRSVADCNSVADSVIRPFCGTTIIDFNELPPRLSNDEDVSLLLGECQASICDDNGQLLMYTNAQSIHGTNYGPIIGGDTINYGPRWNWLVTTDENGMVKPSGYRAPQGAGMIPIPNLTDEYLVIYRNYEHQDSTGYDCLLASRVKKNEEGSVEVITKDSLIFDKVSVPGKITACKHGNGRDWWLLQFSRDTVYQFIITPKGITLDNFQITPYSLHRTFGQAKYSSDGNQFVLYGRYWDNNTANAEILIADFDRCSGNLSNFKYFTRDELGEIGPLDNGVEFSHNGELLYRTTLNMVYQYDLLDNNPFGTEKIIGQYEGELDTILMREKTFGQMLLGPDNRIYIANAIDGISLNLIKDPDNPNIDYDIQRDAIQLPSYYFSTMPTFNTYRLGPLDGSSCDTLGIDNHPVSRFWYEQDSSDFLTAQFRDVSYFRPDEWSWDFGDGVTSDEQQPRHSFSAAGVYEVCLTVSNENSAHTSCDTLFLGVSSVNDQPIDIGLSYFPNPTEGPVRFVLSNYLPIDGRLIIYDNIGGIVINKKMTHGATSINLIGETPGTYYYILIDGDNILDSGKIIKQ